MAVLVLAGLVQSGCGDAEGQPRRLAACQLLAKTEVEQILQGPVAGPAASQSSATDALAGRSGCAWATHDDSKAVLVELVRTTDMADEVRRTGFSAGARFDAVLGQYPNAKEEPGLGDRAIYVEETATLHVLVGRSYVTLEVAATPPPQVERMAVALAGRAVVRLRRPGQAD
ncbi:MAG: hypothetical protein KY454_12445 [Actinobacteria bacterium]|nr:hypothetical protein [Actinomycetota bacterium]MBW3649272.1 hypothetical protein [Actinomycetota bacterium]